jgi:hypothetical protein
MYFVTCFHCIVRLFITILLICDGNVYFSSVSKCFGSYSVNLMSAFGDSALQEPSLLDCLISHVFTLSLCACYRFEQITLWLHFTYVFVFSFQVQRPEQSVMQALESLNDSQVRANRICRLEYSLCCHIVDNSGSKKIAVVVFMKEILPDTFLKNRIRCTHFRVAQNDVFFLKMAVFSVIAPCSLVEVYRRFRGSCCLHHRGDCRKPAVLRFFVAFLSPSKQMLG